MQRAQHIPARLTAAAKQRLNAEQVRIVPSPPPKTLAESRHILAALQKFGEVTTFRNLKVSSPQRSAPEAGLLADMNSLNQYDVTNHNVFRDHTILARFDTQEAAARARAASPLSITLPAEKPPPLPDSTGPRSYYPLRRRSSAGEDEQPRQIDCVVEDSYHDHRSSLKRNPFFGTYNLPVSGDFPDPIYSDMIAEETGVPLKQLADTLQSKKFRIRVDVKRRIWHVNSRMGGTSLKDLWEEGQMSEREKRELQKNQREMDQWKESRRAKSERKEGKTVSAERYGRVAKRGEEKADESGETTEATMNRRVTNTFEPRNRSQQSLSKNDLEMLAKETTR
ncbi:uncharacterized protein N7459_002564 [Penicillium hispanicum]|uniref:uncharacterized protein n=1 Tax=Penicillium hispanicum TaxID=1080232 RepID=UPI002541AC9C|nr:uncharacterized protein N7459_002564 [Penicillium hispanicum]KAJ5586799.1 hypothetical protein N7459_002564 [Penicillium hispanicum]